MMEVRRILCPTDFSASARRALAEAATLARWYEARLTILYVAPLAPTLQAGPMVIDPINLEPVSAERIEEELRAFAEPATRAGLDVHLARREGPAAAGIVEEAEREGADVIVMATHGRSGLAHLLIGSVAEKVVRHATTPVLTIRVPGKKKG